MERIDYNLRLFERIEHFMTTLDGLTEDERYEFFARNEDELEFLEGALERSKKAAEEKLTEHGVEAAVYDAKHKWNIKFTNDR